MEWHDEGIVLSTRKHGETSAIVTLLTREHGRHLGLVRGGMSANKRGLFQPGNRVRATWRARLLDHLGSFSCEMGAAIAAPLMADRLQLAALSAACAIAETALPEREPFTSVYEALEIFLNVLDQNIWPTIYVKWELGLLQELGFRLDLSRCAASGKIDNLTHVSPKTGRAVSKEEAEPYKHILLRLPPFLITQSKAASWCEILDGLRLTGFFLEKQIFNQKENSQAPPARGRLISIINQEARC